jgi:hypothetical protein
MTRHTRVPRGFKSRVDRATLTVLADWFSQKNCRTMATHVSGSSALKTHIDLSGDIHLTSSGENVLS